MTTHIYRRYDPQTRSLTPTQPSNSGGTTEDNGSTVLHFVYTSRNYPESRVPYIIFEVKNAHGENVWFSSGTDPSFDGYTFAIPYSIIHAAKGNKLRYAIAFSSLNEDLDRSAFEQSAIDALLVPRSRSDELLIRAGVSTDLPMNVGPDAWLKYFKENILIKPVEFNQSTGEITFRTYDGAATVIDIGTGGLTVTDPDEGFTLDEKDLEIMDVRPRPGTRTNAASRAQYPMKFVRGTVSDFTFNVNIERDETTYTRPVRYIVNLEYNIEGKTVQYNTQNYLPDTYMTRFGEMLHVLYVDPEICIFTYGSVGCMATKREDKGLTCSVFNLSFTRLQSGASGTYSWTRSRSLNVLECVNGTIRFRCGNTVYCQTPVKDWCYYIDVTGEYGAFDNINSAGYTPVYVSHFQNDVPIVSISVQGQIFMFDDCQATLSFGRNLNEIYAYSSAIPLRNMQFTENIDEYGRYSTPGTSAYWTDGSTTVKAMKMILPFVAQYADLPPDAPEGS